MSALSVVISMFHLKVEGYSRCIAEQTVPDCHNLYRNSFTYHCLQDEKTLDFDGATQFLGIVHVMLSAFWFLNRLSYLLLTYIFCPVTLTLFQHTYLTF
jgi:hypothetical protein